ncbi:hypothetical protein RHSIM_Rhsim01G0020500 [Rhododendron simsii]|uniref:Reverse transcriptase Ty1/copia-type domain-containing protein n=1 Tax=Rhododendron simsii TaxID=118357 RepID=A0A834HL47_RHOSS|nr:hypothetical protein RHSIM_Rhsim01G0020500 [Rhododendron simsii]
MFDSFKQSMVQEFKMTDIGLMAHFLGIEVMQRDDDIFISQVGYAKNVLKRFGMEKRNPVTTPVESGVELKKNEVGDVDPTYFKSLLNGVHAASHEGTPSSYGSSVSPWYFDSGATSHVTPDASQISAPSGVTNTTSVTVGNGQNIPVAHSDVEDIDAEIDDAEEDAMEEIEAAPKNRGKECGSKSRACALSALIP